MNTPKPLILVVDPQRAFIDPSFEGDADSLRAFDSIQILRSHAKKHGIPLVIAQLTEGHSVQGAGGELMMTPQSDNEYLVQKRSSSTFGDSSHGENKAFANILKDHGVTSIVICGYKTSDCVYRTMLDCVQKGYVTLVAEDAIGGGKPLPVGGYTPEVADFKETERQFVEMFMQGRGRKLASTALICEQLDKLAAAPLPEPPQEVVKTSMSVMPGAAPVLRAPDKGPPKTVRPTILRGNRSPNPRTGM